ncbi:Ribosome maturation factor rimM [Parasphaerochaeta coccoides DSM 17374]|uniref:Ribosome maturation factor RimM n=2 Tax=Parasphaerochaeta TaxID=3062336 RepID=F4GJA0_PARC1|nr:Ribosome maturation factor rimM [Parasphaerochaeta coccoides DSM 17374]
MDVDRHMFATGMIKTPHGIRGEVKVVLFGDAPEWFKKLKNVELRSPDGKAIRTCKVETCRMTSRMLIVKFQEFDTPETARSVSGWEVWIPREKAAPLEKGEYYLSDLMGCNLTVDGQAVAHVVGFVDTVHPILLEVVASVDGRTYYVPFSAHFTGDVDVTGKTIVLTAPWVLA